MEGEVNGLMTYDRRVLRTDVAQWKRDIQALYNAAAARVNGSMAVQTYQCDVYPSTEGLEIVIEETKVQR